MEEEDADLSRRLKGRSLKQFREGKEELSGVVHGRGFV
jgi:hypothetical protein